MWGKNHSTRLKKKQDKAQARKMWWVRFALSIVDLSEKKGLSFNYKFDSKGRLIIIIYSDIDYFAK